MKNIVRMMAVALVVVASAGCAESTSEPAEHRQPGHIKQAGSQDAAAPLLDLSAIRATATTEEARRVVDACETGDTLACYELGDRLHGGDEVVRDNDLSIQFIDAACSAGYDRACYDMGVRHYMGAEVPQDMYAARSYFQTTCDMDYALGCHMLARVARQGLGGPANAERAAQFAHRSCELGWIEDCDRQDLANVPDVGEHEASLPAGAPGELVDAARRCDSGLMSGCTQLGRAYRDGEVVEADADTAFDLFESACDWGKLDACEAYRDMQASGM